MLAPVVIFGAFPSQWQIASHILHAPVEIPVLSGEFGVLYQIKDFWTAGGMEIVDLAAAIIVWRIPTFREDRDFSLPAV